MKKKPVAIASCSVFLKHDCLQVSRKVLLTLLAAKTFQVPQQRWCDGDPPACVSLTVLAVLQCNSMVQSTLAFAFPQAQAHEAEIHLSPALAITDVRQEKKSSCLTPGN